MSTKDKTKDKTKSKVAEPERKVTPAGPVRITVGGKSYPCRVTMGAMLRFKRATGHDVSELRSDDMEELLTFIHSCVASACAADGVEFGLSLEAMADNLEPADLNSFYAGMDGSNGSNGSNGSAEPDGEKKSLQG